MSDDSIQDAQPCDIYVDPYGHVWEIVGIIREPCIIAQRLTGMDAGERRTAGMSGMLWDNFRRIYRVNR